MYPIFQNLNQLTNFSHNLAAVEATDLLLLEEWSHIMCIKLIWIQPYALTKKKKNIYIYIYKNLNNTGDSALHATQWA
jgi:hypothetical protein